MKSLFAVLCVLLLLPLLVTGIDFREYRMGPALLAVATAGVLMLFSCFGRGGTRPTWLGGMVFVSAGYFFWRGYLELSGEGGVESYVLLDWVLLTLSVIVIMVVGWLVSLKEVMGRGALLIMMMVFGLVNAGIAFYQEYGDPAFFVYQTGLRIDDHASGIFGHHNIFASSLNAVMAYSLALLLLGKLKWQQVAGGVVLVVSLVALYFSKSRGGMISCGLGLAVVYGMAFWKLQINRSPRAWIVGMAGVVSAVCLMGVAYFEFQKLEEKVGDISVDEFRSNTARLGVDLAMQEPVIGNGARSFAHLSIMNWDREEMGLLPTLHEFVHNEFVQVFVDYGAVGLVLILLTVIVFVFRGVFRLLLPRSEDDDLRHVLLVGAIGGVGAFLGQCFFSFLVHIPSGALILSIHFGVLGMWVKFRSRSEGMMMRGLAALGVIVCAGFLGFWGWEFTKASSFARRYEASEVKDPYLMWEAGRLTRQFKYYNEGSRMFMERALALSDADVLERKKYWEEAERGYRKALELNPYSETATVALVQVLTLLGKKEEADQWQELASQRFHALEKRLYVELQKSRRLLSEGFVLSEADPDQAEIIYREALAAQLRAQSYRIYDREQNKQIRIEKDYLNGWLSCQEGSRLFKYGLEKWKKRKAEEGLAYMQAAKKRYDAGFKLLKSDQRASFPAQYQGLLERIQFLEGARIKAASVDEQGVEKVALGDFFTES